MRALAEFVELLARLAVDEGVEAPLFDDMSDGTMWIQAGVWDYVPGDVDPSICVTTDDGVREWWPECRMAVPS